MKKLFTIFASLILLGLQSNAQHPLTEKGSPILPYRENGYTKEEVKAFALGSSKKAVWWRTNMLRVVNAALKASGETIQVDETNVSWVIDQVVYERRVMPKGYLNSRCFGDECEFYPDRNGYDGIVGVLKYGKCTLDLYKTICANLFDVTIPAAPTVASPPVAYTATGQPIYIIVNGGSSTASITNSGNSTVTSSKEEVGETRYTETRYQQPAVAYYQPPVDSRRSWYGGGNQQQGWRQTNWNVDITYQPPVRVQHQWPQQPTRQNPIRFPNDADGHGWNPNAGGLIRIPNDANGHAFGNPPANQGPTNQGGGGTRLPNNN